MGKLEELERDLDNVLGWTAALSIAILLIVVTFFVVDAAMERIEKRIDEVEQSFYLDRDIEDVKRRW